MQPLHWTIATSHTHTFTATRHTPLSLIHYDIMRCTSCIQQESLNCSMQLILLHACKQAGSIGTPVQVNPTLDSWMIRAVSLRDSPCKLVPLTFTNSSPGASEPSSAAGVRWNTWTTYKQGQKGEPPPILMPTMLFFPLMRVTLYPIASLRLDDSFRFDLRELEYMFAQS